MYSQKELLRPLPNKICNDKVHTPRSSSSLKEQEKEQKQKQWTTASWIMSTWYVSRHHYNLYRLYFKGCQLLWLGWIMDRVFFKLQKGSWKVYRVHWDVVLVITIRSFLAQQQIYKTSTEDITGYSRGGIFGNLLFCVFSCPSSMNQFPHLIPA